MLQLPQTRPPHFWDLLDNMRPWWFLQSYYIWRANICSMVRLNLLIMYIIIYIFYLRLSRVNMHQYNGAWKLGHVFCTIYLSAFFDKIQIYWHWQICKLARLESRDRMQCKGLSLYSKSLYLIEGLRSLPLPPWH